MLQEPTLVTKQAPGLQRELLTCVLTVLEGLDAPLVTSLWYGKEHRARALFQLLELALELFQVRRPGLNIQRQEWCHSALIGRSKLLPNASQGWVGDAVA